MSILPVLLSFAFIASFTPGPNNILMMSQGINYGFKSTLAYQLGGAAACFIILGCFLAVGAELRQAIPAILPVMNYLGCAYLLFLAYVVATSKPGSAHGASRRVGFGAGIMLQFVNPKYYLYVITLAAMLIPRELTLPGILFYTLLCSTITVAGMATWAAAGAVLQDFCAAVIALPMHLWAFHWHGAHGLC